MLRQVGLLLHVRFTSMYAQKILTIKTAIFIVLGLIHGTCFSQQPVLTEITGVLMKAGHPVSGATIEGCTEFAKKASTCAKPFNTKTDRRGHFRFFQETGYPECTKCPCIPGAPSACDPQWYIIFQVKTKKETVLVYATQLGDGLVSAEFECDIERGIRVPIIWGGAKLKELVCFPHTFSESSRNRDVRQ